MASIIPTSSFMTAEGLFSLFNQWDIRYQNFDHNPVMTCADKINVEIPGAHTKNLFLTDGKGKYWLVSTFENARIDLKILQKILTVKNLRFGSADSLKESLGILPGAVSMFAIVNDWQKKVTPIIDPRLLDSDQICFHPLHNSATVVISNKDLVRFFTQLNREYKTLDLAAVAL